MGYGNLSDRRTCTPDQVWATTDTSRGVAGKVAAHLRADYQVNAISGRGVVRNYDGFAADTLPQAYPYALFDKAHEAADAAWHPQAIVVSLGTNDFATPLHAGEKWATREQLHADFEAAYLRFLQQLHARQPDARLVLWASGAPGSEIQAEVARVAEQARRAGLPSVGVVPVADLALGGCDYHPNEADDQRIADALVRHLDAPPAAAAAARPAIKWSEKLVNDPRSPAWSIYGADQSNEVVAHAAPQDYPAARVTVRAKGRNPWDAGAGSPLGKPVAAGDLMVVALYLRAPALKDGESTPVPYFGLNEGGPPYGVVAQGAANVTNQWKLYYASGRAAASFGRDALSVGVHLAGDKHVLDLGPVLVYDLGPDADPSLVPSNNR